LLCPRPRTDCPAPDHRAEAYPCSMDKKEIESPKLTANFLIWISAFMVLLFVLIAHFVWRVF
jgi:hypothetical protein